MSQTDVALLPVPLILFVHLHILEYPHANNPEYDEQIFNPRTRGMRERAKTMEDVTYFLVGKIEGKSVKSILPTYPCTQPSESLAFRTSLTKYLEALRHRCIYPSSARPGAKAGLKSSNGTLLLDKEIEASWWKDVVVRKSLLEECSGEKFERLVLSLSTHVLMKKSRIVSPDKMSTFFRSQPSAYSASIAAYQAKKHAWSKTASLLMRSEHDLNNLRDSLGRNTVTQYETVPTVKLQALAESKLQALLEHHWAGEAGKNALALLVQLAGVKTSRTPSFITNIDINASSKPSGFLSPLPIAAAHHPSHLKKLRRPVFQPKAKTHGEEATVAARRSHAEIMLAELIDFEKRMRQNLVDAISRMKRIRMEMKTKPVSPEYHVPSKLFWMPPASSLDPILVDPVPGKELLLSVSLPVECEALYSEDSKEDMLEKKIEYIRTTVLPPYPAMPDQSAPRKPPLNQREAARKSKIPQTSRVQYTRHIAESTSPSSSLLKIPKVDDEHGSSLMIPSKSSRSIRRKSVHFSMVQKRIERAASLLNVCGDEFDDEVDRLVDETNDFPTDDENTDDEDFSFSPLKTPKSKPKPTINRIWTSGTPPIRGRRNGPGQVTLKPRVLSALTRLLDLGPSVSLPSMPSTSSSVLEGLRDELEDDKQRDRDTYDVDATPRPLRTSLPHPTDSLDENEGDDEDEDEDVIEDDPPSMTLKEILLSTDTSHFDLLEDSNEDIEDEMLVENTSFDWE